MQAGTVDVWSMGYVCNRYSPTTMNISRRISGILCGIITLCCLMGSARAQFTAPPEIVSAWKLNGVNFVMVFRYDGTFYVVDAEDGNHGMERGTFEWDDETGAFSANVIVDTDGDAGLSADGGQATTISITGNTLNYTVAGDGTYSFTRVVNPASAIVGTWTVPGENFSITFLSDLTYYHAQVESDVPFGYTGMEKGTYTWNPTSKAFTATTAIDTNGEGGLGEVVPGVTINVTGNTLVFTEGLEISTLTRITTNPKPLRLPDFGTVRYAEYNQTSNSAPALKPFNEAQESSPYFAEVFVDFVGATAPTIKIGAGATIPLDADTEDPSDFYIEQGYATLAELNTILPASTALEFKNGTATANMTTGASLTFPSIPKILVGSGASWNSGVYRFGDNEVLQWTLPTGFVASQYLTVLNIIDPATGQDIVDAELHGDVTFYDLGGKLEPGKQYGGELEFYRIDTSTTAGNGVFSGKQGYTLSASSTYFKVRSRNVFPEAPFITEQPVSQPGTSGSPLLLTVGINEGAFPFSTFQWFKDNQEITGQTGNCLHIPNFNPTTHTGSYHVVVRSDGEVAESLVATLGTVVNPYDTWKSGFFSSTQLANPAVSGDHVDFDNDGIRNLLEFVLGGSPIAPNANLLKDTTTTTPATVGQNLVFSYDRKTEANGIAQVIETSSTLTGTWTPAVNGVNGVVIATSTLDASAQRVTATIPSTGTMLFVRLNATR